MIGMDRFVSVFGSVPAGDSEYLIQIISDAVRNGFHIVLDKPGTKIPMCTLNPAAARKADQEARELAASKSDPRFEKARHPCGIHHALSLKALTATDAQPDGDTSKVRAKVSAVVNRMIKLNDGAPPNIGVIPGPSGYLVVDVDTATEVQAFTTDYHSGEDVPGLTYGPVMTVQSPGSKDAAGNWVHKDGGHYWYLLPDGYELPESTGKYSSPSGWVALWDGVQVLVPPSSRPEGHYQLIGASDIVPAWLLDVATTHAAKREARRTAWATSLPSGEPGDIDRWAAGLPWDGLLTPDGWLPTGLPDSCGCPVWTAPGTHASTKSATAHEPGCSVRGTEGGHGTLHVWTDNPPKWMSSVMWSKGWKDFTKYWYVVYRDYAGDERAFKSEYGLLGRSTATAGHIDEWVPESLEPVKPAVADDSFTELGSGEETTEKEGDSEGTEETEESEIDDESEEDTDTWRTIDLSTVDASDSPPPSILPRSDGQICLLYPGLIHSIHGEPESGKSWIMQAETVRLVKDGKNVLFLDFENNATMVVPRFRALGCTDDELKLIDYRNPSSRPDVNGKWFRPMFSGGYALVVIDGVTDALGIWAMTTKDNDEISTFLRKIPRPLARRTGAAVVLIDHVVKNKESRGRWALGGQAKLAGLDGAAYVVETRTELGRGRVGTLTVKVAKDKPGHVRGATPAGGMDANRLSPIGIFVIDASDPHGHVVARLDPPEDLFTESITEDFDPELLEKVMSYVLSLADGCSVRSIAGAVTGRGVAIQNAIRDLIHTGDLTVVSGPRNARIHFATDQGRENYV